MKVKNLRTGEILWFIISLLIIFILIIFTDYGYSQYRVIEALNYWWILYWLPYELFCFTRKSILKIKRLKRIRPKHVLTGFNKRLLLYRLSLYLLTGGLLTYIILHFRGNIEGHIEVYFVFIPTLLIVSAIFGGMTFSSRVREDNLVLEIWLLPSKISVFKEHSTFYEFQKKTLSSFSFSETEMIFTYEKGSKQKTEKFRNYLYTENELAPISAYLN